jgi:endonuclease III
MRGATECAKRLKQFFSALRSKVGKVSPPSATDPITQLILGALSRDTPEAKASEGLERLRGMVVDYNELRVIPPIELAELLDDFPDARLKCEDISRALNAVFATEHTVSLDRLAGLTKKEAQAVLDEIDGLEAYTRARIRLLGLQQHAIPLDEAMWALARREGLVDPRCPLPEAQQFFERQVPEDAALEFVALLKKQAWAEMGAAVRKREVERILSVPPDRTSRNMLQLVGRLAAPDVALHAGDEPPAGPSDVDFVPAADALTVAPAAPGRRPPRSSGAGTRTKSSARPTRRANHKSAGSARPRKTAPVSASRTSRRSARAAPPKPRRARATSGLRGRRTVGKPARKAKSA